MTFLYLVCVILSTSLVALNYTNMLMGVILLVIIIFFVLLEILELAAYLCYEPRMYFGNFYNYVDWAIFIMYLDYMLEIATNIMHHPDYLKITGMITLSLIFYRGLLYLEIIDYLISIIYIIRTVVGRCARFANAE